MLAETQSTSAPLPLEYRTTPARSASPLAKGLALAGIIAGLILVIAVLVWQALTAGGSPDPSAEGISPAARIFDTGILVFREGLEAILVLAALTASLTRTKQGLWKPVALGAGASLMASVATWFIVVAIITNIDAQPLKMQAATGLLAVVVLLIIMNWFFHKIYWTGWITHHNRRKKNLLDGHSRGETAVFGGLLAIGFTSVYREGFEVVLFLQQTRLQIGGHAVLIGVLIGLALTCIVAILTFIAHYKLPYKRMLVLTGIMIGAVLLVMVGEEIQEMQQAGWMWTHTLPLTMPAWLNTWFSIYPTVESLVAQFLAGAFVIGSYFLARRVCQNRPKQKGLDVVQPCIVPDCANCEMKHGQSSAS